MALLVARNAAPLLSSVVPLQAPAPTRAAPRWRIDGQGFAPDAVVSVDGQPLLAPILVRLR